MKNELEIEELKSNDLYAHKFPIGKYSKTYIKDCSDLQYLKWYDSSIQSMPGVRRAVFERIQELIKKD